MVSLEIFCFIFIFCSFSEESKLNRLCVNKEWNAAIHELLKSPATGNYDDKITVDVNATDMLNKTPIWWVVGKRRRPDNKTLKRLLQLLFSNGASLFCGSTPLPTTGKHLSLLEYIVKCGADFYIDQLVYNSVMYPTPLPPSTNMVPTFFSKLCFCLAGWDEIGALKDILADLCHAVKSRQASVECAKRITSIISETNPNFFVRNAEFVHQTVVVIHSKVKRLRDHIRGKTSEVPGLKSLCIHSVRNRCKHIAKGLSIIPTVRQLECTVPKSIVHDLLLIDEFQWRNYEQFYKFIMSGWQNGS